MWMKYINMEVKIWITITVHHFIFKTWLYFCLANNIISCVMKLRFGFYYCRFVLVTCGSYFCVCIRMYIPMIMSLFILYINKVRASHPPVKPRQFIDPCQAKCPTPEEINITRPAQEKFHGAYSPVFSPLFSVHRMLRERGVVVASTAKRAFGFSASL